MPTPLTQEQQEQVLIMTRTAIAKVISRNMPGADREAQLSAAKFAGQICGQLDADLEAEWSKDEPDTKAPRIEKGLLFDIITVIQSFSELTPPDAEVRTMFMDEQQLLGAMREWGAWDTEYREKIMTIVAKYLVNKDFPAEDSDSYEEELFDIKHEAIRRGWRATEPSESSVE